jgi:hypothetical protein
MVINQTLVFQIKVKCLKGKFVALNNQQRFGGKTLAGNVS